MSDRRKPFIIGVTGSIGSGKSTVGAILTDLEVPVIDTDRIVHDLLEGDHAVIAAITDRFGKDITRSLEGRTTIDRTRLGRLVFADPAARRDLERIVHPATILECRRRIDALASSGLVAVLVPLLFEAGLESEYDEIWTVFTDEKSLKRRIMERDGLSGEDTDRRLAAQLSQAEKISRSRHTIDNSGTKENTRKQVEALVEKLKSGPGAHRQ
ncbi:MAG: dephospho-CoA kinase [Candidatus Melainabacteria bacterium]|nr:dephospho-CoA kinase [Candidatus Melainabacteria bacterium]